MKSRKLKQVTRMVMFGAATILLAGFGSCSTSVQDICARRLPEFDNQVSAALARLSPSTGRGLARADAVRELDNEQREQWLAWAESRLFETQRYLDAIDGFQGQKPVQYELSDIATALVQFHGYARQGRQDRMVRTLEGIQVRAARARSLACAANSVATR